MGNFAQMDPNDPLAGEPGEPFPLPLRRAPRPHAAEPPGVCALTVRALARRTADGTAVGLLLLQDLSCWEGASPVPGGEAAQGWGWAALNAALRGQTQAEQVR